MSNQLLPCPFCGGKAKRFTLQDEENFGGDVIACQNCDACSRVVFGEKEGLVEAWNRRATQPAAGEPLLWQVRHCDNDRGWGDWEEVVPRSPALGQTVEHRLQEYQELIGRGYRYELRALGIAAPPAAAHGEDGRTCRFCQKRFDSAGECGNHVDQFHHGEAEPAAHGDEAVRKDARVDDLAALTRRLVQALCKAAPDHALPAQALDYLDRSGLRANPLRARAGEAGDA